MKNRICTCLIVALLISATGALSPAKSASNDRTNSKGVVAISGEVSSDGRTFVSDQINKWTVVNPALLKGHEGAWVTVRCRVDPDQHAIQVISVAPQRMAGNNSGDSAFRR